MAQIQSPLLSSATIDAARTRLRRIADSLPEHRIDAILIGTEKDILYLTGFIGHDSLLLVMPGTSVIITDARYDEFLDPWRKAEVLEVMIGTRHRLEHAVKDLCRSRTIRHLGFQADSLTVSRQQRLAAALGDSALHATEGIVAGLRRARTSTRSVGSSRRSAARKRRWLRRCHTCERACVSSSSPPVSSTR